MNTNYTFLKQVVDLLEEYENAEKNSNILDFAHWIIGRYSSESEDDTDLFPKIKISDDASNLPLLDSLRYEARFLEYLSRIARYHEFYIRKALLELNINTRLEFLLLQTIENLGVVKKTDLVSIHLLEYTTGIDTIHRLIKKELVQEVQSSEDKRVKLLKITREGEQMLKMALKRINEENEMFLLAINNKWKKTIPLLEEIDNFHNNIYHNHNAKPFAEICNLVDSLKHLYR